jgi:hydroxymethylglutaryl-CoA lyase
MTAVTLCECFARDGLQHEAAFLPTPTKAALVDCIAMLGFARVEATSYANPKVVPQFADASELLRTIPRRPGVAYKATCANVKAVERALADALAGFGATELSLLVSASEQHSLRNLRQSRADQWRNIEAMVAAAAASFRLVGVISVAFGCPLEGVVDPGVVLEDVGRFAALGVRHVTLGDTTGLATPAAVRRLAARIRNDYPDLTPIAHFHDTRGTALVNCVAALDAGITWFDCAIGGVGGHPAKVQYGEGHTGNACTEDLVSLFESMGVATGIAVDGLLDAVRACEAALGRGPLQGPVARSRLHPQAIARDASGPSFSA